MSADGEVFHLKIRALKSKIPIEHRLRAIEKRLLRTYGFVLITHRTEQEEKLNEAINERREQGDN